MRLVSFLGVFAIVNTVLARDYKPSPPTFEAKEFTKWEKSHDKSKKGSIAVSFLDEAGNADIVNMMRVDLVGDAKARGFAHGALLTKEIIEFTGPKLDQFYASEVLNIDISGFPQPLQDILKKIQTVVAAKAPAVFKEAMAWVWEKEAQYVPQNLIDEMDGIAEGMCSNLGPSCNVTQWSQTIKEVNMLPELIRMACTAFGAWGPATEHGGLVQLRALDFGSGPFANYTVLAVHRGDPANPDHAFASVSFPAFVGVITGIAQNGIGVSEKVWMTYDKRSLQPGSYNGEADVFVLRDILEKTNTREEAAARLAKADRTWGMWIGVGDFASQKFDLVAYRQSDSTVYNDVTMPSMTGQPYLEAVAYVDSHPQPSGDGPNGTLPTALQDFYGSISLTNAKTITQYHRTGDLHIATYDYKTKDMFVSIGRINKDGNYGADGGSEWKAYNRPYLHFSLEELWQGL